MNVQNKKVIQVETTVKSTMANVWLSWTEPEFITKWNFASDDWCCPAATNELITNGKFSWRMEAKDGSFGFDFSGKYDSIELFSLISSTLDDGRKIQIEFKATDDGVHIIENFEAEELNSLELQKNGWQAILDNFKKFTESYFPSNSLTFEVIVNAPITKVFQITFDDSHYREWTKEFNETSHFIGNWEKNSKILFVGCDKDGNIGGMVSRIFENIPDKFVSIEHLGLLQGDKEITSVAEVEQWAGSKENYLFFNKGDSTLLVANMDSNEEMKDYFLTTFPKALNRLKEICESEG